MPKLNHISKYYNTGTINEMCLFQDFNLSVEEGQFVSVVGSNGSGKTSMLNIICGSIPIDPAPYIGEENITYMPEFKRQRRMSRVCLSQHVDLICGIATPMAQSAYGIGGETEHLRYLHGSHGPWGLQSWLPPMGAP